MFDEDDNEIIDTSTDGFTGGEGSGNWWEDLRYGADPGTEGGGGSEGGSDAAEEARMLQLYKDLGILADDATDFSALSGPIAYLPGGGTMTEADFKALQANSGLWSGLAKPALDKLKSLFTNSATGKVDFGRMGMAGAGLAGLLGAGAGGSGLSSLLGSLMQPQNLSVPTGYQGGIPNYTGVRQAVQGTYDPTRRAGSGGQRYFTDTTYATPEGLAAAQAAAGTQATGLAALNASNPARQSNVPNLTETVQNMGGGTEASSGRPASEVIDLLPVPTYAKGGDVGRYLDGPTDGMADKLKANIEGEQEAKLSHGEFVISADVVAALGGGNNKAGAKQLYDMMDRVRHAAMGRKKQMSPIEPKRVLPA